MKKSTKILLCLSAAFIALGTLLTVGSLIAGVDLSEVSVLRQMSLLEEKRVSPISPDGQYALSAEGVRKLEVNWMAGTVTIEPYDGTQILLEERGPARFENHNSLQYQQNGKALNVSFAPTRYISLGWLSEDYEKDLLIRVPEDMRLDQIDLSVADADLTLRNLALDGVEVNTINSDCSLVEMELDSLTYSSCDGSLTAQKSRIRSITSNTLDGDVEADLLQCPASVQCGSTDGSLILHLPENSGFTVQRDSIGGTLDSDFAGAYHGNRFVVGSGSAQFQMDTLDGSVRILKQTVSSGGEETRE